VLVERAEREGGVEPDLDKLGQVVDQEDDGVNGQVFVEWCRDLDDRCGVLELVRSLADGYNGNEAFMGDVVCWGGAQSAEASNACMQCPR
jgi:hypothetical protein